jgi:hypothetical protein
MTINAIIYQTCDLRLSAQTAQLELGSAEVLHVVLHRPFCSNIELVVVNRDVLSFQYVNLRTAKGQPQIKKPKLFTCMQEI